MSLPCLNSTYAMIWNSSHFWTLNRYCVECTCFGISYSGSASSNASKAVRNSYTTMHTQNCFVMFRFMARGHSVQLRLFFLQFQPNCFLLFTPTRLSQKEIVKAFLSVMPSNAGSFQLKPYFYEEFLIMKGVTASLRNCGCVICTKYQSCVVLQKQPF